MVKPQPVLLEILKLYLNTLTKRTNYILSITVALAVPPPSHIA